MGTGGGMQRWMSAEGAAEDVAEKDKLPLKNYLVGRQGAPEPRTTC